MKVLYAGDSPLGGTANYLLGILRFLKADFLHLPPAKVLKPRLLKKRYDAIILSDFSRNKVPVRSQQIIAGQVKDGAGFLMIGGWASFSGPFGGWRGSVIEEILPVSCLNRDDRVHFPGGAHIATVIASPAGAKRSRNDAERVLLGALNFKNPPVICGLNQVRPKRNASVLLVARRIRDGKQFPLLVIDSDPRKRIAALATDLAPHWSGGLVDWGRRRLRLQVKQGIQIEVGDRYIYFVSNLIRWLGQ